MWCLSQLGLILYTLKLKPLSQLFQALLHQSDYLKSRWKPRQGEESTADIGPLTRKQNKSKLLSFPGLKGRLDFGGSTPKFSVAVVGHDRPTQARGDLNLTRQAPEEQWLLSALWTGQDICGVGEDLSDNRDARERGGRTGHLGPDGGGPCMLCEGVGISC